MQNSYPSSIELDFAQLARFAAGDRLLLVASAKGLHLIRYYFPQCLEE